MSKKDKIVESTGETTAKLSPKDEIASSANKELSKFLSEIYSFEKSGKKVDAAKLNSGIKRIELIFGLHGTSLYSATSPQDELLNKQYTDLEKSTEKRSSNKAKMKR